LRVLTFTGEPSRTDAFFCLKDGIYFRLLKELLGDDAVRMVQAGKASP